MKNIKKLLTVMLLACIVVAAMVTMSSCDIIFGSTDTPDEHQHTLTEVAEVVATCDKAGTKAHYTCSGCEKLFADAEGKNEIAAPEAIEPKGHTEVIDAAVEATCSVAGKTEGKHCSVCNTVIVEQEVIAPLGHKWNEGEVTLEPTCVSKGSKLYTCERGCNKVEDIEIDADAHSWDDGVVAVPATCSEEGTIKYTCKHNSEHTKTEKIEIDADAHSWDEGVVVTPATCSEEGTTKYTCKHNSEHTKTEKIEIDANAHSWDEGVVVTPATCSEEGTIKYTCKHNSEHTKTEKIEIDADAHSWDEGVVVIPATCSEEGTIKYTCKHNSEHTYTEDIEIDADAHSWDEGVETPATCTDDGYVKYTCKHNSEHTYSDVLSATGHSYSSTLVVEGAVSHYEPGTVFNTDNLVVKIVCTACDHFEIVTGYTISNTEALQPSDTEIVISYVKGEVTYTATVTIEVSHEHVMTHNAAVPATCETDGSVENYYCSICQNYYADEEGNTLIAKDKVVIEKLGHDWQGEVTTAPTCETEGVRTYTCKNDGSHTYTEVVDALDHDWVVEEIAPTCTEAGVRTHICKNDSSHNYTEELKALDHDWVVEEIAPTCTEAGVRTHICKNDASHNYTEELEALDHDWVVEEIAPTCTEAGVRTHICKNDASHNYTEELEALDHDWVVEETAPTCTEAGVRTHICKNDASHNYTEELEALDHDWVVEETAATCTEAGVRTHICKNDANHNYTEEIKALGHDWSVEDIGITCTEAGIRKHICNNDASHNYTEEVAALGHDWSDEITEGADGFQIVCNNNCGEVTPVDAPVADSYNAVLDNDFASAKDNILNLVYAKYGAWGIATSGSHKVEAGSPASGAIGGLDKAGQYVYYEFVMDKPGTVDLIWNIAGSNYKNGGNAGLADMAQHMTITIDGKPVDVSGIALPAEGQYPWWNLQNVVIKDVVLDAGVHTFKCDITAAGGLNVGSMTVKSTKDVNARGANVTSAKVSVEGEKVYYVLTADVYGYTADQIKFWHDKNTSYDIASCEIVNNVATIKIDVTDLEIGSRVDPHLSFDGKNYVNGSNWNADVYIDDEMALAANGKSYVVHEYYSMPSLYVEEENYLNIRGADIYEEDGKAYYTLTYLVSGYDPASFEFFNGSTVYEIESLENNNGLVTFKFDLTDKEIGFELWPHLKVNGEMWDGANNTTSSNGDVKVSVTTRLVTIGEKTYIIRNQYSIPTITVVDKVYMNITGADIYAENDRLYYTLTYFVANYDPDSFEFFDGNTVYEVESYENNHGVVTFKIDVTDMAAGTTFYPHLRVNGQKWDSANNTSSSNGDVKVSATTETITLGDKSYTLKVQWSMPTVVVATAE